MVTTRRSPSIRRRRLGAELRGLRGDARLTINQVAMALGCSDSRISRIETGQVAAGPRVVGQMLDRYGVTGERREALLEAARMAQEKGWWQAYSDAPVMPLMGLEAEASSIRMYEARVIPGLFQTSRYAESLIRGTPRPKLSSEQIERWLDLRMTRQKALLSQGNPPTLTAVIDEAVLHRPVGGSDVLREQLRHLAEIAARPTVTLRVLLLSTGEHAGLHGSFTVFGFSESEDLNVVYLEHITGDLYLEDKDEVGRFAAAFDELCELAVEPDDSRALIAALAESRTLASPGRMARPVQL